MPEVFYNNNPTISDTVVFNLQTTDSHGTPINPYKVNVITIYYIERGFTSNGGMFSYDKQLSGQTYTQFFSQANPIQVFGNDSFPAWIGTDTADAFITQLYFDNQGNPLTGVFQLKWVANLSLAREGDYVLCYSWTPIAAGDTIQNSIQFYLFGDSKQTTSIPTHYTNPNKYPTLLDRYLPEMFKIGLYPNGGDLTPDVINRLDKSIASGFTDLENLATQILDLIDANSTADALLPYLGNLFNLRLKTTDVTLWRRQIKEAIPLFKRKGTLGALQDALSAADVSFVKFTKLWQVVSQSTWQEGFIITKTQQNQSTPVQFTLQKLALLPANTQNYQLWIRYAGSTTYTPLRIDYVSFQNVNGVTIMTWVGNNLSVNPISLIQNDVVVVVYEIAVPPDQSIENYIRTLPLADQRDELTVTFPLKNWNVRVIAEDDAMFDLVIPTRHPFQYPVVFGKIRTEFPYSENIYNMETYNGSTRNSTNPCDLDKTFLDSCSQCLGSKYTIDVQVEDLSADRLVEVQEVIEDYTPFHAVVHSINYTGSKNEFFTSPQEEIEILCTVQQNDNVISSQMDFNRLVVDGSSDVHELKRNMLASYSGTSASGTASNIAVILFSPGVKFDTLGVNNENNFLEILSGTYKGTYGVQITQVYSADIVGTISWPLDTSAFPFRLSNTLYHDVSASIYQDDIFGFSDANVDFISLGLTTGWSVTIKSGLYAGNYSISNINTDGSVNLSSFPTTTTQTSLSYSLLDSTNTVRFTGSTGQVVTQRRGRVEMDMVALELGFLIGDYVLYSGTQYLITQVLPRQLGQTVDKIYISGYTSGNVVGVANITVYRRLLDGATGYLDVRGLQLVGTVPTISTAAETNQFIENYLIQIGLNYYKIDSISGSTMILDGPLLYLGTTGISTSYTILQFIKTSPINTEPGPYQGDSRQFNLLDRRGNESFKITVQTSPTSFDVTALNQINKGEQVDMVSNQEDIWINIEYRE